MECRTTSLDRTARGIAVGFLILGACLVGEPSAFARQRGPSSGGGRPGQGGVRPSPSRPYPYPHRHHGYPPYPYPYPAPPVPIYFPTPIFVSPPPPVIFQTEIVAPTPSGGGLGLPSPTAPGAAPQGRPKAAPVKRVDPAKGADLVKIGDRLFRAGNTKRAEERYLQSMKADPKSAAPHLRMAQLALTRGKFAEAADHLREAQAAEPGWMINAIDIQTIYAEPSDFAEVLTKLESHVQAHPGDRDAWLALGAQFFLSGRVRQASDIFQRLSDRKVDETLAAFIDASSPTDSAPPATARP